MLNEAAAIVRNDKIVDFAKFRAALRYVAICPECHKMLEVEGYATTRPPLCTCNARMEKWA